MSESPETIYDCWPTAEQELLLKAALLDGDAARAAWERWRPGVDFDEYIDYGSFRLLPRLYENLLALGVDDPLMPKFKGIHRKTWVENQLRFHRLAPLLDALAGAGVSPMLLKGAAMLALYYRDWGVRPMSDLDLLVRPKDASRAARAIVELGWEPLAPLPRSIDAWVDYAHAVGFKNADGDEIDLHWHLTPVFLGPRARRADDDLWDAAVEAELLGRTFAALCPADQLLHVCAHGYVWNSMPPVRWVADAAAIVAAADGRTASEERSASAETLGVDWNRLVAQARKRRQVASLAATLGYLRETYRVAVPEDVVRELGASRVSAEERFHHHVWNDPGAPMPLGLRLRFAPRMHWFAYARGKRERGETPALGEFAVRMRERWGLRSAWQIPGYLIGRYARRAKRPKAHGSSA